MDQQTATFEDRPIPLTPTERRLLVCLARSAGRVLTTEQLLAGVWGAGCRGDARLIQVNISRLRQKIEPDRSRPVYIHTLPGVGYHLALLAAPPRAECETARRCPSAFGGAAPP